METSEISIHQLRVYEFVAKRGDWVTAREIANGAKVSYRTANGHAFRLMSLGIFDRAEVFPAHRYRMSALAEKRNMAYVLRLRAAREAFNIQEGN